ncbi:flippase-like domain-containing protein [Rhodobacteraceae bacterium NNCM2]|nr:flippase-like domain-containing protein [Coraliihabitans acroporae]
MITPNPGDAEAVPEKLAKKGKLKLVATGLAIAVVCYAIFILVSGYEEMVEGIRKVSTTGWLFLLGLSLANFLIRFGRWQIYLRVLGHHVAAGISLLAYLGGFALTTTPGKLGEVWRAVYLKPYDVTYSEVVAAFFAERYTDLLAIILLSCLALGVYEGATWPFLVFGAVAIAAVFLLRAPFLPDRFDRWAADDRTPGWIKGGLSAGAKMLRSSSALLTPMMLGWSLPVAVLAWGLQGVVLYGVLDMLGFEIDFFVAIGIYSIAILAGTLSFIPGGLGSTEAVMVLLLYRSGIDTQDALAATLVCRIATLWFAVVIGVGAVGMLEARRGLGFRPK